MLFRKEAIFLFVLLMTCPHVYSETTANEYLTPGRAALFNGTISGVREAYSIFDQAANDPGCIDCAENRELIFFHAISRMGMWVVREDGGSIDSGMELAKAYGTQITGDYIRDILITEPTGLENRYDSYDVPSDIDSKVTNLIQFIDGIAILEIDQVISNLDQIQETPEDLFKIYLSPLETQAFLDPNIPALSYDIEIDYAEIKLLKGVLLLTKAFMQAQSAYDTKIDEDDKLLEKLHGDSLLINEDVLLPHPELLKVLPTANDPNNGKAILFDARENCIAGIQYYLESMDYILSEDIPVGADPQDDELLSLDPNYIYSVEKINNIANTMMSSLIDDTAFSLPYESINTYSLSSSGIGSVGLLQLNFDPIGHTTQQGKVFFDSGVVDSSEWEVSDFTIERDLIYVQMENMTNGFVNGYFWGTIDHERSLISNATLDYWGDINGTINSITGALSGIQDNELTGDLNPLFGSSPRYPDPVSPRDVLPEFDRWNSPLPNTVGMGIGFDSTLGGIAPEMTQKDWTIVGNLQPYETKTWLEIESWQKLLGWVGIWLPEQLILDDIQGDVYKTFASVPGTDIKEVYMGYDSDYIHGCISLYDIPVDGMHCYEITLSYSPTEPAELDALRIQINLQNGQIFGTNLEHRVSQSGHAYWSSVGSFEVDIDFDLISFRIPFDVIPSYLWGRYVSVDSSWGIDTWDQELAETNPTHIKMNLFESTNTISGTVSFNGFVGAPIYIQACADPLDPDSSITHSVMLSEPGPFVLEGLGLGWNGYIRAFTPLFGFDIFDMEAIAIQVLQPASQYQPSVNNINLILDIPPVLQKDVWVSDEINITTNFEDVFAFDAVQGGTYTIELSQGTASSSKMSLAGRNGTDELMESFGGEFQTITWLCPVNGRYYVKVSDYEWDLRGGTYQIRTTSNVNCPVADISGADWIGVKDCRIDIYDFVLLASHWLDGCSEPYWCEETDYDEDSVVDPQDLLYLLDQWLYVGEITPLL
jgi:hypothetical protein